MCHSSRSSRLSALSGKSGLPLHTARAYRPAIELVVLTPGSPAVCERAGSRQTGRATVGECSHCGRRAERSGARREAGRRAPSDRSTCTAHSDADTPHHEEGRADGSQPIGARRSACRVLLRRSCSERCLACSCVVPFADASGSLHRSGRQRNLRSSARWANPRGAMEQEGSNTDTQKQDHSTAQDDGQQQHPQRTRDECKADVLKCSREMHQHASHHSA